VISWRAVPEMPVQIMLLPRWFPVHLSKISYWARTVIVPLLVLRTIKPRARNPSVPIVLRIAEANLAASIARHFQFEMTFSVAALAGPVFAGLSRVPGARGRIAFDGQEFAIVEVPFDPTIQNELPHLMIPLAAVDDGGEFTPLRDFAGLLPGTRTLILVRLDPFREGRESFPAVVERVYSGRPISN
jgi:hypothetical protein